MTDRGYWARLGLEGFEESPSDHPLGFHYGTLRHGVVPRMAVLLKELTTQAQLDAFNALLRELGRYCHQTNGVIENLREMARDFKGLEDDIEYEVPDVQKFRELRRKYPDSYRRFDPDTYKRSTIVARDLAAACYGVDWEAAAAMGRRLDGLLAEERAREDKEAAERHAVRVQEEKARREAAVLERLGVLYKTSLKGVDESIPKNPREDIASAEKQLVAMGFTLEVEGPVHCCIMTWGDFTVYADPRGSNSLRFNVYKGTECLHTFWLKDKLGDPRKKVEGQLSKLQEQDRATTGFVDSKSLAGALRVSEYEIKRLIERGMPVSIVGSVQRFNVQKVLEWANRERERQSKG